MTKYGYNNNIASLHPTITTILHINNKPSLVPASLSLSLSENLDYHTPTNP
jgi:hypothetical protein